MLLSNRCPRTMTTRGGRSGCWSKWGLRQGLAADGRAGEGMPSIRVLAKELTVSVITTKRAYEELEKEGVIESVPGRGFYVCEQKNDHLREKQMMNIEKRMSDILKDCENAGMTLDDVIDMVRVLGEK